MKKYSLSLFNGGIVEFEAESIEDLHSKIESGIYNWLHVRGDISIQINPNTVDYTSIKEVE